MKITDFVTQISNREDVPFLRIPLFDVNMRLFHSSEGYRNLILASCSYIQQLALETYEDYPRPFGMSGANAGIPFNIIGYVLGRKTKQAWCRIMINPRIVGESSSTHVALSNCGSIRLPQRIRVRRRDWVKVDYLDEAGELQHGTYGIPWGNTVQHEIDHNRGILITDLEVQDEDGPD